MSEALCKYIDTLVQITLSKDIKIPYDNLGNRLTFTYNGTSVTHFHNVVNEITKINSTQVYYDNAGNLTKDDATTGPYAYYYDAENRLTKIFDTGASSDVASYEYDAFGRRIEFINHVGSVTNKTKSAPLTASITGHDVPRGASIIAAPLSAAFTTANALLQINFRHRNCRILRSFYMWPEKNVAVWLFNITIQILNLFAHTGN